MKALIRSLFVMGSLLSLQPSWANPSPMNDPKSACEVFARNRLGGNVTAPEVQKWLVNCQNRVREICMGMTRDGNNTCTQKDVEGKLDPLPQVPPNTGPITPPAPGTRK